MTEIQVWRAMRESLHKDGDFGLCNALRMFDSTYTWGTFLRVQRRINAAVRRHPYERKSGERWVRGRGGFGWPLTPKGTAARVAFCDRQIARLRRERRARRAA
jgi:hypothetical protein